MALQEQQQNENIVWKDIIGYEKYEISSQGTIRNKKTGRILKCSISTKYPIVNLSEIPGTKQKSIAIHKLMAKNFLEISDNRNYVDHIDGNPKNNKLSNLRYCNQSENLKNKVVSKNKKNSNYKGVYFNKKTKKFVAVINKKYIGSFKTDIEAGLAWNMKAQALSPFYRLNVIENI